MPHDRTESPDIVPKAVPWAFSPPYNAHTRADFHSFIYLMRTPSRPTWLKIGLAQDVEKRLMGFRLGNPDIEVIAFRKVPALFDRQIEKAVHADLSDFARGREWFEVTKKKALQRIDTWAYRAWKARDDFLRAA